MSTSTDEFDFTEFTEEELGRIDSIADAAFASDSAVWPTLCTSIEPTTNYGEAEPILPEPNSRSRKSSGFSVFDLTEEELRLLDESVAHLESGPSIQSSPGNEPPSTASVRSTAPYIEISLESPLPSTLDASPAPTLGRDSSFSPAPITTMSLYTQFRLSRNSLSVSDLVGPAWCELQFDYGLRGGRHLPASQRPAVLQSRTGKAISVKKDVAAKNDIIKQGGTTIHKKLEREIRPTEITVTTKTREDRWGLKLLDMLSNIRILIDEGRCREMPVMGFIHGHFVSGVIDEITRTPVPPVSPTSPIVPGHFPSTDSLSSPSAMPSYIIHILDNKTRGVPSIPKSRDSYQSRLQLMLYKRLLDGLLEATSRTNSPSPSLSTRFSLSAVWDHHSVNLLESFSAQFLEESAVLVFSNQLGPAAAHAKCLKDLEHAWEGMIQELAGAERIGDEDGAVSKRLKLVYRLRERTSNFRKRSAAPSSSSSDTYKSETGKDASPPSTPPSVPLASGASQSPGRQLKRDSDQNIIGSVEFDHDDGILDRHLSTVLDFWHDRRPPKGVALEDTGRCTYCEFADGCEWLEERAAEIAMRTNKTNR
ncbi:hypothetical protein FRC07_002010 [Ceratobasidium sp. 392]|nr:hypothetical protein FRC07_002010 [Ceratobasidium sp. 392]